MKIEVISESGYIPALFGLGLSYGITSEMSVSDFLQDENAIRKMTGVALKLCTKDGGHNKFLESMFVALDIDAPRYWWSEFDTYRVGTSKQSESTMHTIRKRELNASDFEGFACPATVTEVNLLIRKGRPVDAIKAALPEGFLQRRIVTTNYRVLRNMILQRRKHRLPQWRNFCASILEQVEFPEFLPGLD